MTAITPVYAHACQATCLAQHFPGVSHHTFRLPKPKSRYPYRPNDRSTTRELGNDYHGGVIHKNGGTRVVDGETLVGWGVISRYPDRRIDVMFGPVFTIEAHLAFSGARIHSNNTAEMTAMIEALSFLRFLVQSPVISSRVLIKILCMLLLFDCAQSKLVHMCVGFGSPCSTCVVIEEIWVTNVLIMPLHLAHSTHL